MKNNFRKEMINFDFPSKEVFYETITELTAPEHLDRNLILVGNFSNLDKIKFGICQAIINYKSNKKLNNKQLIKVLGLQEELLDRLLNLEITSFALDSLISYTERLQAPLQINIELGSS